MPTGDAKTLPTLGFLTVLEHEEHGLMGGYLILNSAGRPVEFHCTAPVKPNRAQQILYGPTLEPFLYGEQIGQALVAKSQLEPLVICTDLRPAMAVRSAVDALVALVLPATEESAADAGEPADGLAMPRFRVDAAHAHSSLLEFHAGRNRLAVEPNREADRTAIVGVRLEPLGELFDLLEPFQRIREAIEEARGSGR